MDLVDDAERGRGFRGDVSGHLDRVFVTDLPGQIDSCSAVIVTLTEVVRASMPAAARA